MVTPVKAGRPADSVNRIYQSIRTLAADYAFRPGERINEVELAAQFDVSRTPVREAMNRLVRDGFIEFVPNRGFFACELTPESIRHFYEMRAALEYSAFKLACARASEKEIQAAVRPWEKVGALQANANWVKVARADEEFHLAVARLSKNPQIVEALEGINLRIRFFRRIDLELPPRRAATFAEHAAIIEALRERRAAVGADIVERHVTLSSNHAIEVTQKGLARIFDRSVA